MPEITGRFYFKLTANGNLLGEYSNNYSQNPTPEGAERNKASGHEDISAISSFIGSFHTVWLEDSGQESCRPKAATLKIDHKDNTTGIFTLKWTRLADNRPYFEGEAMLCDDILIGNYWSSEES